MTIRPSRKKFAASHQRSWMWGRHAVLETLRANRWPVTELFIAESSEPRIVDDAYQLAKWCRITPAVVPASRLTQLCGSEEHQGLLARMGEYPCGSLEDWREVVARSVSERPRVRPPLYVVCDGIQDAQNFGAILRCCDGAACDGVLIASQGQSGITPHVARSSAGAVNHLQIFRVEDLADAMLILKVRGVSIAAASEKSDQPHWSAGLHDATAVIIGNEATGIRPELMALCDLQLRIPMLGCVTSLNAAVAAGILLYEIRRTQVS